MIHYLIIIMMLSLATLAFWKMTVYDTARQREALVKKIISGQYPFFICGGIAYGNAVEISSDYITAMPLSTTETKSEVRILDKKDITRLFIMPHDESEAAEDGVAKEEIATP